MYLSFLIVGDFEKILFFFFFLISRALPKVINKKSK